MGVLSFKIPAVIQQLRNGLLLAEGLLFPEITRLNDGHARVLSALAANARKILEAAPLLDLHRRRLNARIDSREVELTLDPPDGLPLWTDPLPLSFHAVTWQHGDSQVARIPALSIEVVAGLKDDLDRLLPLHVRATFARRKIAGSLRELLRTQQVDEILLDHISVVPQLMSPRDAAKLAAGMEEGATQNVLAEVGIDLCAHPPAEAYEVAEDVARLANFVGGESPASVLLVGPSGVGKTAIFNQLVRERAKHALGFTPFWSTSGSRLVAGQSGFGMWQQRCDNLRKEAAKTRAIVHLGSLMELIDVGKAEGIDQGVAGFLRPYIARGDLLCVAECTPEQLPLIERQEPQLLNAFMRMSVDEPKPKAAHAILRKAADVLSTARVVAPRKRGAKFAPVGPPAELSEDGLDKLERLHRRFATYSAWPGRPLRFLRNVIRDGEPGSQLSSREITAAFSRETGLPNELLDEDAELKLDGLREYFTSRVIAQDRATELVVDLIATFKAGLSRPKKPLASFLFIGPTGVGKTEMARSLAEYLFGDRNKLSRFDMSEYADAASVRRLITGRQGEGLLTAKVREQPFAVILFDEFEKADASFFDLLLQVLGEGRLTDARGRVADFTTSVIIMTSNLGAQSYMQGGLGFAKESAAKKAEAHFTSEVKNFLRPELLNRIDRIVPFLPLNKEAITRVAARELELAALRAENGGRVDITFSKDVAAHIAAIGWQEKYGARPLKRAIEQHLLVPIASKANERASKGPSRAEVAFSGGELAIAVNAKGGSKRGEKKQFAQNELALDAMALRRRVQQLLKSPCTLELTSEIFNLERQVRQAAKKRKGKPASQPDAKLLKRLPRCKECLGRVETLSLDARSLESRALMATFGKPASDLKAAWQKLSEDWRKALLGLYLLRFEHTELCTIALNGERPAMNALAQAYLESLRAAGFDCALYRCVKELSNAEMKQLEILAHRNADARRVRIEYAARKELGADICVPVFKENEYFENPPEGFPTLAIQVFGENALPKILLEPGMHLLLMEPGQKPLACRVDVTELAPMDYRSPKGELRKKMLEAADVRRKYDLPLRKLLDMRLNQVFAWSGRDMHKSLSEAFEASFEHALNAQVVA